MQTQDRSVSKMQRIYIAMLTNILELLSHDDSVQLINDLSH